MPVSLCDFVYVPHSNNKFYFNLQITEIKVVVPLNRKSPLQVTLESVKNIHQYVTIARPLSRLLKDGIKLEFVSDQIRAFTETGDVAKWRWQRGEKGGWWR